ncbi:N-acetyltransferase GCN5 [Mycobacteroides abscessus]|nr:N-acetyltransferase GCN5 [Mycobacteroides abscessus]
MAAAELPPSPPDAWTLATVGVLPSLQGTGLGSAVCRAALRDPALGDAPVALETSDARNVTFYERLGFVRTATTQVHDGPVVHGMVRTPTP